MVPGGQLVPSLSVQHSQPPAPSTCRLSATAVSPSSLYSVLFTSINSNVTVCLQDFVPSILCAGFIAEFEAAEEQAAALAASKHGSESAAQAVQHGAAETAPIQFVPTESEEDNVDVQSEGEVPEQSDTTVPASASEGATNTPAADAGQPKAAVSPSAPKDASAPHAAPQAAVHSAIISSSSGSGSDSDATASDSDSGEIPVAADDNVLDDQDEGSMRAPASDLEADDVDDPCHGNLSGSELTAGADSEVSLSPVWPTCHQHLTTHKIQVQKSESYMMCFMCTGSELVA